MTSDSMRTPFSLVGAGVWVVGVMALPLVGRTLGAGELVATALTLLGCWALGAALLAALPFLRELPPLVPDGAALLVGAVVAWPLCALPRFAFAGAALLAAAWLFRRVERRGPRLAELAVLAAAFALATLLSVVDNDLARGLGRVPAQFPVEGEVFDALFADAAVASMRSGSLASVAWETGSRVAYQALSLAAPALFSRVADIPPHVALWGLAMPFYHALGLCLLGAAVARYAGRRPLLAGMLLYLLLQPLHPKYLARLDVHHWVWDGLGWVGAGFAAPTSASLPWAALVLLALFPSDARRPPTRGELCFGGAAFATLAAVKVPMFAALGIFLAVVALLFAIRGGRRLLATLALATPAALAFYAWSFRGSAVTARLGGGYLVGYLGEHGGARSTAGAVLVLLLTFAVWGSLRFVGLGALAREGDDPDRLRGRAFAWATLAALAGCIVVANLLRIENGRFEPSPAAEQNQNLLQFPRHAFLLVSLFGAAGLWRWASRQRAVAVVTIGWCALSAVPLVARNLHLHPSAPEAEAWRAQAVEELRARPFQRAAIDPSESAPGLLLCASGVGPFWVSQHHVNKGAAITARWATMTDALGDDPARRAAACATLVDAGVDALVATPKSNAPLRRFAAECAFAASGRWIYRR
jgi:hypothetical protein